MEKIFVKAVIFDFDGTLVDTESIHIDAWKKAGKKFGVDDNFDYSIGIGVTDKELSDIISKRFDLDSEAFLKEKYRIFLDFDSSYYKLYDGVLDTIKILCKKSIPMAIASNSLKAYVETISSYVKLDKYINCRLGTSLSNTTLRGKPYPDLYIKALERLHVDANDAIVIEDSPLGIEAGRRAGIYTFGITNNFDEDRLNGCNKVINKIDEIFDYIEFEN